MDFPETPKLTLSSDVFRYWVLDYDIQEIRVVLRDGSEFAEPMSQEMKLQAGEVRVSIFDWEKWWVENFTSRGHLLFAEVYSPVSTDPFRGRPSVYLDQAHWSTVSQAMIDPSRVKSAAKLTAAKRIIELATDGGIVLPLSSANFTETARLNGDRRYEVGVAMASLAGGWQMRHPLQVRRQELVSTLAAQFGVVRTNPIERPVITLEPHAFLDDGVDAFEMTPDSPELFTLAATSSSVMAELLLNPERIDGPRPASWTEANRKQGTWISTSSASREQKRQLSYAFALADHQADIFAAMKELRIDTANATELIGPGAAEMFQRGNMIDLYTRIVVMRQADRSFTWRTNDLVDIMFLSCAAAYSDYVAAEKATGTHLAQAQRGRGDPVNVFTSLESVVEALDRDGVQTAEEKAAK
jgi:hypothetical protein